MTTNSEAKLLRLRDITLAHMQRLEEAVPNVKDLWKMDHEVYGQILDDLEHDIVVYFKNFIMTLEQLDAGADVKQVGDNSSDKSAIGTKPVFG